MSHPRTPTTPTQLRWLLLPHDHRSASGSRRDECLSCSPARWCNFFECCGFHAASAGAASGSGQGEDRSYDQTQAQTYRSECAAICDRQVELRYEFQRRNGRVVVASQQQQGACNSDKPVLQSLNNMPGMTCSSSHPKEKFIEELELIIKKIKKFTLHVDEGWYSESEMKGELNWSSPGAYLGTFRVNAIYIGPRCFNAASFRRQRIAGAKKLCEANPELVRTSYAAIS